MVRFLTTKQLHTDYNNCAMETRDHSNGVSPKNQRSRGIFITVISLICFCFTNCSSLSTITSILEQSEDITKINLKTTLRIGESYKLKIEPTVNNDFTIVTSVDGSLTLSFETFAETTYVALYDKNGNSFEPASKDIVSGTAYWDYYSKKSSLKWNTVVEKFTGSFTYKLDAGTYNLRITRSQKGLSTANLSLALNSSM